jgi:electron transport complex protein RnfA
MSYFLLLPLLAVLVDEFAPAARPGPPPGDALHLAQARFVSLAAAAVLLPAASLAWLFEHVLLAPAGLAFLGLLVFLLLAAVLAQLVERIAMHRTVPPAQPPASLAARLTVIVLLLGAPSLATLPAASLLQAIALAAGFAAAFGVLRLLFAALRLRLALADVPERMRGAPIALLTAGLMALALLGFDGMLPG